MKSKGMSKIVFNIEPSDTSVGIMSESFTAWWDSGTEWCELEDIEKKTFKWYSHEGGLETKPPIYHKMVETCLLAYAKGYYNGYFYGDDFIERMNNGKE